VLIGQKDAPSGIPVEIDCDLEPDELIKEV